MRRSLSLAAGLTGALFLSTAAFADTTPGYYVSGTGGVSLMPNLKLNNTPSGNQQEDLNTGYAYGGSFGYDFGDGKRLELSSLHTQNDIDKLDGGSVNGHVSSTNLMLNGQMDLTQGTDLTPYAGAGIGIDDVSGNIDGLHGGSEKPAYQAEAGLRKDLSPQTSLFAEYRFTQSEAANFDDAHQHFADHGLLAGMTYHMQ